MPRTLAIKRWLPSRRRVSAASDGELLTRRVLAACGASDEPVVQGLAGGLFHFAGRGRRRFRWRNSRRRPALGRSCRRRAFGAGAGRRCKGPQPGRGSATSRRVDRARPQVLFLDDQRREAAFALARRAFAVQELEHVTEGHARICPRARDADGARGSAAARGLHGGGAARRRIAGARRQARGDRGGAAVAGDQAAARLARISEEARARRNGAAPLPIGSHHAGQQPLHVRLVLRSALRTESGLELSGALTARAAQALAGRRDDRRGGGVDGR